MAAKFSVDWSSVSLASRTTVIKSSVTWTRSVRGDYVCILQRENQQFSDKFATSKVPYRNPSTESRHWHIYLIDIQIFRLSLLLNYTK